MPDITNQFIGPLGGLVCIAFAMGCIAGWGFAVKLLKAQITEIKADMQREREDCHTRLADHARRIVELEDRSFHGMERQLVANRDATVRVIGDLKGTTTMGGTP